MENGFDRKYGYTMAYRGKVGGNAETSGCNLRKRLVERMLRLRFAQNLGNHLLAMKRSVLFGYSAMGNRPG